MIAVASPSTSPNRHRCVENRKGVFNPASVMSFSFSRFFLPLGCVAAAGGFNTAKRAAHHILRLEAKVVQRFRGDNGRGRKRLMVCSVQP